MHQVSVGELTIGGYTAFATYVSLYEVGFSTMADLWINLKQTIASTGRFLQLLERRYVCMYVYIRVCVCVCNLRQTIASTGRFLQLLERR